MTTERWKTCNLCHGVSVFVGGGEEARCAACKKAYAAGRASVIESEDFKVVRDAAEFWAALRALDALETAILQPITSAELSGRAATIRAALEALR